VSNVRQTGKVDRDIAALISEVNRCSEAIEFTVAVAGTEVEIIHGLGSAPSCAIPCATKNVTGGGVIVSGPTAWTNRVMYLTASATGKYAVIIRR
jgi:hypothetical protein